MVWGAIAGVGASLLGSALGGGGGAKYKFRPGSYAGPTGSSAIDKRGNISTTESPFYSGARQGLQGFFGDFLSDPTGQYGFGTNMLAGAQGQFPGVFDAAQQAGFTLSDPGTMDFINAMGQNRGMFQNIGQAGVGAAFGAPSAAGVGNFAGQFGMGLLGNTDLNQLAADRTAQLNQLAGPAEATAANQKFQGLFNRGMLGTSGGAQQIGQLQQAQQAAAAQRGLMGMDFAEQVRQANLGFGQGFLGQNLSAIGMDQAQSQFLGQLGSGFLSGLPGIDQSILGAQVGFDERNINRADQRLSRLTDLFGFAQQQREAPVAAGARTLGAMSPLDANAFNLGNQAISAAQVRSGNTSGGGSPVGAALQGVGQGLFGAWANNYFKS